MPLCVVVRHLGSSEPNGDKYRPAPERPYNVQVCSLRSPKKNGAVEYFCNIASACRTVGTI